ncbi:MAG: T9SS type A sorting domain-containing protein [Bacteroidetes bacterium]|nr:T9SS type A sorting domain-containing protein [Bacteroidota bacterium]
MKKLLTIFILLHYGICFGQNLVPNPSFEQFDTCPDFDGQISRATGWYSAENTPDYFNNCAVGYNWCTVPSNYFGYRTPASGDGYAGFIARWGGSDNSREALEIQLLTPLQTGTKYYASFKVSLGGIGSSNCGINKLGILFSNTAYSVVSPITNCNNCAQICSDSIVTDTVNWTRLTGSFTADSNYTNLIIRRFNFNSLTDYILLSGAQCGAYYYIDDVCVSTDSAYVYGYNYTAIHNLEKDNSVSCFPNPFSTQLTFSLSDKVQTTVSLRDLLGQQVLRQSFTNSTTLNTELLADGIYFYELRNSKGTLKTGKLIKQ